MSDQTTSITVNRKSIRVGVSGRTVVVNPTETQESGNGRERSIIKLLDLVEESITLSQASTVGGAFIISNSSSRLLQVDSWLILDPFLSNCEFVKISSISGNIINLSTNLLKNHASNSLALITTNPKWDIRLFGASTANSTNVTEIQAAINNANVFGGTILVPSGIFKITRTSTNILSLASKSNITFDGDGTIQLTGSLASSDTFMFKMDTTTSNITFRNITLDGGKDTVTNTVEQTHIIEVNAGSLNANISYLTFENVKFKNAVSDGIRMVGSDNSVHYIQYVSVKGCPFTNCGRSGVTIQRGVRYATFSLNTYTEISDQFIDMEPSGNSPPHDITISGETCINDSPQISLSIAGISDVAGRHAYNITVNNLTLINGSVVIVYANDVTFNGGVINAGAQRGVDFSRACYNLTFTGGLKVYSSVAGLYGLSTSSIQFPYNVKIIGCDISMSGGTAINFESVVDFEVIGNSILALSSSTSGFTYRPTVSSNEVNGKFFGNTINGFTTCVTLNASSFNISHLELFSNIFKNATVGTSFNAEAGNTISNVLINNFLDNVTNQFGDLGETVSLLYTGVPGNVGHYNQSGTPESSLTAPVGSWCTDRDTGDIYYKATGTSNTGWVLK